MEAIGTFEENEEVKASEESPELERSQSETLQQEGSDEKKGANDSGGEDEGDQDRAEKINQILDLSQEQREVYKNLHPQRNTFTYQNGIQISSDFDGGNLLKCQEGSAKSDFNNDKPLKNIADTKREDYFCYDIWICPDGWPYLPEMNLGRAGFFFSVTNLPEARKQFDNEFGCEVEVPRNLRIHVRNFSNQTKMIGFGHKICAL